MNEAKKLIQQITEGIQDKKGKKIIGVIPEEEGTLIKDFLDMGWDKLFCAIISQNDDSKTLENRFKVAIYIAKGL